MTYLTIPLKERILKEALCLDLDFEGDGGSHRPNQGDKATYHGHSTSRPADLKPNAEAG